MEFCPKCGAMLVEKTKNFGCPRCNYTAKGKLKIESTEKVKEKKEIAVINEKDSNVHPTVPALCPKCGHREAYFWTVQTRSSDEAETRFFKCTKEKCSHTWREYH